MKSFMKSFYGITSSISFILAALLAISDEVSKATFAILVAIYLNMLCQGYGQQDK